MNVSCGIECDMDVVKGCMLLLILLLLPVCRSCWGGVTSVSPLVDECGKEDCAVEDDDDEGGGVDVIASCVFAAFVERMTRNRWLL